jgi:hypothetical protein
MKDVGIGIDSVAVSAGIGIQDCGRWLPKWSIEKYNEHGELYAVDEFDSNSLLIEGIEEFMKLGCGIGGTAFSSANAAIGVGDGTAATTAGMTGLQGANKAYAIVDPTYPQVSGNTMTFQATFGAGVAAFQWNEFSIANGLNEATAKNINRKADPAGSHGTKGSLDTWIARCSVTIS